MTVSEKRCGARADFESVARHRKAADTSGILALGVSGPFETKRGVAAICGLSTMHLPWGSHDHHRIAEDVPANAAINDPGEMRLEMDEDPCDRHLHEQHHYRCPD